MSALCLAGDGLAASLFASALHLGWTGADGIAREESWHVWDRRFEFLAERTLGAEGWRHAWPPRAPQARLVLERRALREDYVLCGEGWCAPLERFLPRQRAPSVEIRLCPPR